MVQRANSPRKTAEAPVSLQTPSADPSVLLNPGDVPHPFPAPAAFTNNVPNPVPSNTPVIELGGSDDTTANVFSTAQPPSIAAQTSVAPALVPDFDPVASQRRLEELQEKANALETQINAAVQSGRLPQEFADAIKQMPPELAAMLVAKFCSGPP